MATPSEQNETVNKTLIYILPQRIQRKRLEDIKTAIKRKKLNLTDTFTSDVTHVVTETESFQQVTRWLQLSSPDDLLHVETVGMSWLTASLKAGKPVMVESTHRIKQNKQECVSDDHTVTSSESLVGDWACQRITQLHHNNHQFVDALETIQKFAELREADHDYSRALAFRRASCVLKSLPFPVTSVSQLKDIKDMGSHSLRVIQEILEDGVSEEVETIKKDDWFQKMKIFTSVFGVGSSTAKKWIDRGWLTVKEAQQSDSVSKDWRVMWGLAFHSDLMDAVVRLEAEVFTQLVREEADRLVPGVIVELVGGFRRKKSTGHDVDVLITHPQEGKERGLLKRLLHRLGHLGLVLCGHWEKSTYTEEVMFRDFKLSTKGQLDHFEKWLGICKFPNSFKHGQRGDSLNNCTAAHGLSSDKVSYLDDSFDDQVEDFQPKAKLRKMADEKVSPKDIENGDRDWTARRVDLIISPYSQYWYGLVGWTGSKHYNRDLRLYAQRVLNMKLNSHGLYSTALGKTIPATSEREVFDNLSLPYREPCERNC